MLGVLAHDPEDIDADPHKLAMGTGFEISTNQRLGASHMQHCQAIGATVASSLAGPAASRFRSGVVASAHRRPITRAKAQPQQAHPSSLARGPRTAIRLIWGKVQGTRLGCSSIAHDPRDQGPSPTGLGPRSKTIDPRTPIQDWRSGSRDPSGPEVCPWPIDHAHERLGQLEKPRFRDERPFARVPSSLAVGSAIPGRTC